MWSQVEEFDDDQLEGRKRKTRKRKKTEATRREKDEAYERQKREKVGEKIRQAHLLNDRPTPNCIN